jgi:hypothetical protein
MTHTDPIQAERARKRKAEEAPVVQRKLAVGSADDPLEREADRVASDVLRRLASQSNGPARGNDDAEQRVRRSSNDTSTENTPADRVRRRANGTAEVGLDGGDVSSEVNSRIQRARGSGSAMDDSTRGSMETAFGADFGGVRIHTGSESTQLNRSMGAKAFTVGNDVFFSGSSYDPKSKSGQHLLAHELTHTVQQGAAKADESAQRAPAATISQDTEGPVRRFALGPQLDLGGITHIRALGIQGQQTYIASDGTDEVVIKKANIPMNLTQLATIVHESISPGSIIDSQAIDSANNSKLKKKIGDPAVATGSSWTNAANALEAKHKRQGESPDDAARRFHAEMIDGGTLLTVQKVVQGGQNAKELAGDHQKGAAAWEASQLRHLLNDISYMRQMGNMIATDAFMGNEDRVSHTGANLGNWMTSGNQIKRIDNLDVNGVANFSDNNGAGILSPFPDLLKEFAGDRPKYLETCLKAVVKEASYEGDPGIKTWFENECTVTHKKMMLDDMEIGAAMAIRMIDATYGSGKMSDAGRATKDAIKGLDLDDGQVDFWEVLKARAAYMENPRKGDKLAATLRKRHTAAQKKRKRKSKKKK